jgi:hypothetical protein
MAKPPSSSVSQISDFFGFAAMIFSQIHQNNAVACKFLRHQEVPRFGGIWRG